MTMNLVFGAMGMVGTAIRQELSRQNLDFVGFGHDNLDCENHANVEYVFQRWLPKTVYLCAAKVGGILANSTEPADFVTRNLKIQTNVIEACHHHKARLIFFGSSCIYPRDCPQPMREEHLLTGPLEPTNEAYAIAKIAGIKMCEAFHKQYGLSYVALMPCNLFGPGDNYTPDKCHVIPALIRRFHEAKKKGAEDVIVWGTGRPRREFMYVADLAEAAVKLAESGEVGTFNAGGGIEVTIAELASLCAEAVGYSGSIEFDISKPDGVDRKMLDSSKLNLSLNWAAHTGLLPGLRKAYADFLARYDCPTT